MDIACIIISTLANRDILCDADFICENVSKPLYKQVYAVQIQCN